MDELELLRSNLDTQGVATAVELAPDGGCQLTVVVPAEKKPQRAFSVALRPEGAFLLGFRGAFRLIGHADMADVVARLAHHVMNEPNRAFMPGEYSFEQYPYQKWLDDGRQRDAADLTENGWNLLSDAASEELWASFATRFSFRRSVSRSEWPAITEPTPFVTWSVSGVRELYSMDAQQYRTIEWRSREQLLQALIGLGNLVGRMYALDLNHAGYSFDPNVIAQRGVDKWPVPLIPIHNYSLFVDPAFSVGLFDHPWEESICVFGESLVGQLVRNPLPCFGDVIRSSARTSS
jgi:hypothetical protein